MKHSNLQITLPKPCTEDWDTMVPADRGRYCASCQKTVIDFTLLSDGEILDIFKKSKDNPPCGNFLSTQLDRELIDTRYKPSFVGLLVKRAAAVVILFQSIAATALAQHVKTHTVTTQHNKGRHKPMAKPLEITGVVIDYERHLPVAGIRVQIEGTAFKSITDSQGIFVLTVPNSYSDSTIVLKCAPEEPESKYIPTEKRVNLAELTDWVGIGITSPHTIARFSPNVQKEEIIRRGGATQIADVVATTPGIYQSQRGKQVSSGGNLHVIDSVHVGSLPPASPQIKPSFWQRITKPFRKKPHTHETK